MMGVKNEEESLKILNDLINSGVNEVVFTPHYVSGTKYTANNKKKKEVFLKLKRSLKRISYQLKFT